MAIINETMARNISRAKTPSAEDRHRAIWANASPREIVGVAGDVKQEEPSKRTKPEILCLSPNTRGSAVPCSCVRSTLIR